MSDKLQKYKENISPGLVVLLGSGETSPSGQKAFNHVFADLRRRNPDRSEVSSPFHLALLETPAGFELNSSQVIERVADFIRDHLQNYQAKITIIPARKRGTTFSPDEPDIVAPLLEADMIFMGPGSPTYAVRQLSNSLAWQYILARHRLGATLMLASAAVISLSIYALPVYEIFKAGEDLHWKPGLDFFGLYGLPLVFIPHWNNNEGGRDLDTSHCFMGQSRFADLMEMLPSDLTVIGIDEQTALIMDTQAGICQIIGQGGVTLIHTGHTHPSLAPDFQGTGLEQVARQRHGHVHHYKSKQTFPLIECCPFDIPISGDGLPSDVWQRALDIYFQLKAHQQAQAESEPTLLLPELISPEVQALVQARQEARANKAWAVADSLRNQIDTLGWLIIDTPEGPRLKRKG